MNYTLVFLSFIVLQDPDVISTFIPKKHSNVHSFSITEDYAIFFFYPVIVNPKVIPYKVVFDFFISSTYFKIIPDLYFFRKCTKITIVHTLLRNNQGIVNGMKNILIFSCFGLFFLILIQYS